MGWLETHLEEFVRPVVPNLDETPLGYFKPEEVTIIKNAWRSAKRSAQGRTILLPGRDVWVFEVLARREDYPTVFMPECSRMTVAQIQKNIGTLSNVHLLDTGFVGSIPMGLKAKRFGLLSYSNRHENVGVQIFPRLTMSRGLALLIESTPKYWETGKIDGEGNVVQILQKPDEFERAARLTIEIYKDSSAKFIKTHRPLPRRARGF